MSIEGFVERSRSRIADLNERIAQEIKKDGGKKIHRHVAKEIAEKHALEDAIYKAVRKGVKE